MIVIIASFSLQRLSFFPFFYLFKNFLLPFLSSTSSQFLLLIKFSSSSFFSRYIIYSPHPFSHFWIVFVWFWFFFLNFVIFSLFPFSFSFLSFFADGTAKGIFIIIVTTDVSITRSSSHGVSLFFSGIFFFFWGGKSKMKIIFFPFSVIFPQQWRSLKSGWMRTSCHGRVPPTWSRKNLRQQWTKLE